MPTLEKQRKVHRRVSLQTAERDAERIVPSDTIYSIVKHQISLYKLKSEKFNHIYRYEIGQSKTNKIISDWIYVASNYCVFLSEIDPILCAEMAIELFAAFYLILKLSFKSLPSSDFNNLSRVDQNHINIFFRNYNELLNKSSASYFKEIVIDVEKLLSSEQFKTIPKLSAEKKNSKQSDAFKRRSLDPKTMEPIQSASDLYPQFGDDEDTDSDSEIENDVRLSLAGDDNETFINNNHILPASDSEEESITEVPLMNNIDGPTLSAINPDSVVLININLQKINSRHRKIITMNPSYVNDLSFYQQKVLPFLSMHTKIILFSESPIITHLELTVFSRLVNLHYTNIYWLDGGLKSFKKYFMKPSTTPTIPEASAFPKLPALNDFGSPQINQEDYKQISNVFNEPNIPPIPVAKPLLSLSNDYSNFENGSRIPNIASVNTHDPVENIEVYSSTENNFSTNFNRQILPIPPTSLPHPLSPLSANTSSSPVRSYEEMKLHYKPLVTLKNLGSTCYIDSLIQCLFSIREFRIFFINDELIKTYLMNLKKDKKGKNLLLTSAFHELFNLFYRSSPHGSIPPLIDMTRFLSVIAKLNPALSIPNEQQDTSQFLYFILDELHTELKLNAEAATNLGFVKIDHLDSGFQQYKDWKKKTLQNDGFSYIQNLFNIKESVIMTCERCGYKSTRYDTSVMIHLSVKESSNSLLDIIEQNFYPEEMSERLGNAWDCDGCKKAEAELERLQQKFESVLETKNEKDRNKEKELKDKEKDKKKRRFFKFSHKHSTSNPDLLINEDTESNVFDFDVLNNQLTEYEKSEYNRFAEIFTREKVAFRSVELIELPNVLVFCLSVFNTNGKDAKTVLKNLKYPEILDMKFSKCKRTYKLNSWIDHWGANSHSGHYTATVGLDGDNWITCDDDKLNGPNKKTGSVRDSNVYLLFYECIDL